MTDTVANLLVDPTDTASSEAERDESYTKLAKYARSIRAHDVSQTRDGKPVIELLDAQRNTISYACVLATHIKHQGSTQELAYAFTFLASFDPVQVRYVGPEFRAIIEWMGKYYEHTQDASVIPYIASAILRLDPESSTFTSNHLLLLRLCLSARLPRQALSVLDKDIYNLPTDPVRGIDERYACSTHEVSATFITKSSAISAPLTPSDVHEYYLLGAHIYIGLRRFTRARLFLELVLASPTTHVATPLMVEAYKKLVLVGLLATGSTFQSRGLLDHQAMKSVSALSRPYETLAAVFKDRDVPRFHAEMDTASAIWNEDGNTAIVNQVAESLRRYRVIDLQKTYSALPVDRIAVLLGMNPPATTTLLTTMIRDGHLKATLPLPTSDSTPPVLRFQPEQSPQNPDQDSLLQQKYARIEQLAKHVREADRKLSISKEYVGFVSRNKRAEGAGAAGFEDPMEIWDGPTGDGDEDMMGDLTS